MMEEAIVELLNENGVLKSYKIEHALGLTGAEVREVVRELRRKGYPICSSSKGYWIGSQEEVAHTIAQLRSRGTDMLATANAMENMAISGQLEFIAR